MCKECINHKRYKKCKTSFDGNLESRDYLGDLGANGRILPKQIHMVIG
jgi:hypothetical protein